MKKLFAVSLKVLISFVVIQTTCAASPNAGPVFGLRSEIHIDSGVYCFSLPPGGYDAALGVMGGKIGVLDVTTFRFLLLFDSVHTPLTISESDDQKYIAASSPLTANIWDLKSGRMLPTPFIHFDGYACVAFVGSDLLAVASYRPAAETNNNNLSIWNVSTGAEVWSKDIPWRVTSLDVSPDDTTIVAGLTTSKIAVFSVKTGRESTFSFPSGTGTVGIVKFSPDGNFIAASTNTGNCYVVPVNLSGYQSTWRPPSAAWCMAYCARVRAIAIGLTGCIDFYDPRSGKLISELSVPGAPPNNTADGLLYSSKLDELFVNVGYSNIFSLQSGIPPIKWTLS